MAGETDDADVMGKVLAAELGAEADLAGFLPDLLLEFHVAEGAAGLVAGGREAVIVMGGGELHGEEVLLRGGTADDEGDVVRRAGRGAERLHLLHQERHEGVRIQDGLGHLVQIALVGGTAALHHAQELVFHAFFGVDVDLRRQVALGVDFLIHVQRGVLAVTEVLLRVSLVHAQGEGFLVVEAGPDLLALLAVDDGGAGVLAEGELALGGDLRVAEEHQGDVLVVVGGFRIGENLRHLLVVFTAQEEVHVAESGIGEHREGLGRHLEDLVTLELAHGHTFGSEFVVFRGVFAQLKHRSVFEFSHMSG